MYGEEDPFFVVNFLKTAAKSNGRVRWLLFLVKSNRSKDLHIPAPGPHGDLELDAICHVVLFAVIFNAVLSTIIFKTALSIMISLIKDSFQRKKTDMLLYLVRLLLLVIFPHLCICCQLT